MQIEFYKYQGTGNDFVLIDDRENAFDDQNSELINFLCDRRFGIGADGLMLLRNADGYDFEMVYFNADGNTSSMCGNGGRCITAFANDLGLVNPETIHFVAIDGPHKASITEKGVRLKMIDVVEFGAHDKDFVVQTGSPHYVRFVEEVDKVDVFTEGRGVRNSPSFVTEGINVNFVERTQNGINARTYERGVEDETLSCGTGVTACAIASHIAFSMESPVPIKTLGGELMVSFQKTSKGFENVYLEGPAKFVFKGVINV